MLLMQLYIHLCKIVAMIGNNNKENWKGRLLAPSISIYSWASISQFLSTILSSTSGCFKMYCYNDIVTVFTCYECHGVWWKQTPQMNTRLSKHFLMGARAGRVSDLMAKPWQNFTPEWSLCSVGSMDTAALAWSCQRNCCTLPWREAVVNCCNNTSPHTKYTIKALIVLKSLISTYRD